MDGQRHRYQLLSATNGERGEGDLVLRDYEYDAVIIATPFEFSKLAVAGFKQDHLPAREFIDTHSTFVEGSLRRGE